MKITAVCIQNFLAISDARVELDGKGLVLIQGQNLDDTSADSNGTGKSSIVDALSWCLYGVTARGVSGDAVVNRIEKKDCSVVVYLDDDGQKYKIQRTRKHSTLKNQTLVWSEHGGMEGVISKGTEKETQKVINDIMGCSQEVFKAAVYSGQENMIDLPSLTDKNLKLIVEEAAGIERIEKAYEKARKEAEAVSVAHSDSVTKRDLYWDDIQASNEWVEKAKVDMEAWDESHAERVAELEAVLNTAQSRLNALQDDFSGMDEESIIEKRKSIVDASRAFRERYKRKEEELNKCITSLVRLKTNREHQEKRLKDVATTIKRLRTTPEEFTCDVCGSKLDAEHIAKCEAEGIKELKIQKAELAQFDIEIGRCEEQKKQLGQWLSENKVEAEKADTSEVDELLEQVGKLNALKEDITRAEADVRSAELFLQKEKEVINPYAKAYKDACDRKTEAEAQHKLYEQKAKDTEEEYKLRKATANVFSPSGVRALILDTVTPFLNQRTAEYLSILSDGNLSATWSTLTKTAKGELREKFNIDVTNNKGGESFSSLSGGEKRKVRLATALALQDLVSSRATKPIKLWIGDEIDNALDTSGLERLMTILHSKAKERGTVLIISHTNLRDWCSNVITVTKENGKSVIEG